MVYNYTLALLETAQGKEGAQERLQKAAEEWEDTQKPAVVSPHRPNNVPKQMEIGTERLMLSLEEAGYGNARQMSVFSIETAIIRNKEAIQKLNSRHGAAQSE